MVPEADVVVDASRPARPDVPAAIAPSPPQPLLPPPSPPSVQKPTGDGRPAPSIATRKRTSDTARLDRGEGIDLVTGRRRPKRQRIARERRTSSAGLEAAARAAEASAVPAPVAAATAAVARAQESGMGLPAPSPPQSPPTPQAAAPSSGTGAPSPIGSRRNPKRDCPVCLGPYVEAHAARCGHLACHSCWLACLDRVLECPLCKQRTRAGNLRRVYL